MFTAIFWRDCLERLARSFAQTFLAVWVPTGITPGVDWRTSLIAAGTAAFLSLLMSLAATGVGNPASASLVRVASVGKHEWRRS